MRPPLVIVEAEEEDRVVLEAFALVDGHERNGVGGFEVVECRSPGLGMTCDRGQTSLKRI